MNNDILKTFLIYNPWVKNPGEWQDSVNKRLPEAFGFNYVPRLAETLYSWPQQRKINLVIGPRQCGKSTLIWHTLSDLEHNLAYIDANELLFREWCSSPGLFWSDLHNLITNPQAIFFEEIQYLENAGLFLKGLADLRTGCTIYATGSSSFHLHDKIRESLAGRTVRLQLFPFSLNELVLQEDDKPPAVRQEVIQKKLDRMLVFGSYPEVYFSGSPEIVLNRLVEAFVVRDASDIFRVKFPAKFRKLLTLMASQAGNLTNFSDWASNCGLDVKTVESYANILEESHVIRLVPPYVGGKRAEIISSPKVFFVDNGIRNSMLHQFNDFDTRSDKGALFENWIFSELIKNSGLNDSIYYWRSKGGAEVDFVRQKGIRIEAFEAKASHMARPGLSRSSRSFIDAYSPEHFSVISFNMSHEESIGKTHVRWVKPFEFVDMVKGLS